MSNPKRKMFPEEENISKLSFDVGWQFVQEYYITMNSQPESLYKFYDNKSYFCFGHEGESVKYCHGKQEINGRFTELDFKECKVVVSNIDSQASSDGGIIIQVLGEISNKNEPPSKYAQTFFLAKQPKGYYVLNDIFRYLKEEINNEYDDISQDNIKEEIIKEEYVKEEKKKITKEVQNTTPAIQKIEKQEEQKPMKEKVNAQNESLSKPHSNTRNNTGTPTKMNNQQQQQQQQQQTQTPKEQQQQQQQNEQHKRTPSKTNTALTTETNVVTNSTTTNVQNNNLQQQKQTPNQVNNNTKAMNQNTTSPAQAKSQSSPIQTPITNQAKPTSAQIQDHSQTANAAQNSTRPPVQPFSYSTIASSNKSWSKVAQSDSKSAVIVKQVSVTQQQPAPQQTNQKQSDNRSNNEKDLYTVFIKFSNNNNFTKEEISNALKVFGEIKNVEISSNQRHFCFVEFATIEQTKKAIAKGEVIISGVKLLIEERKRTNKYNNGRMNSNYGGRGNRQDYHENRNYSGGSRGSNDSNMGQRRGGGSNNGKRSYK